MLCLVAALGFAGRAAYLLHYWSDPAHQAQPLEPWMTPRYVARSYAVDPRALGAALGVRPDRGTRPTLGALAAERGLGFAAYAEQVRAVIAHLRATPDG